MLKMSYQKHKEDYEKFDERREKVCLKHNIKKKLHIGSENENYLYCLKHNIKKKLHIGSENENYLYCPECYKER
jgi:hypothetical protein